mmetsp:Transcript_146341/g.407667  ORF Transcript_146341/g.407667 Transcript_146341/m.407667 type:complete len:92 (-) Transcript_146341:114-389(-)
MDAATAKMRLIKEQIAILIQDMDTAATAKRIMREQTALLIQEIRLLRQALQMFMAGRCPRNCVPGLCAEAHLANNPAQGHGVRQHPEHVQG